MSFNPTSHKFILPPLVSLPYSESRANGYGARNAGNERYYKLIVVHGVFMSVAFVLLLPAGILLSRYFYNKRQHRAASQGHAALSGLGIVLVTIGFVTAYFAVGRDGWGRNPHHYIGLATYAGMVAVGAVGVLVRRGQKQLRGQRGGIGSMLHNWIGRGITLLGLANVPLGLYVYGSPLVFYIVYAAVMGVWLIVFFIMEYLRERKQYQSLVNEKWGVNDNDGAFRHHGNHHIQTTADPETESQRRTRAFGGTYVAPGAPTSPGRRVSTKERFSAFGSKMTTGIANFRKRGFSGETVPTQATSRPPSEHSRVGFEGLTAPPPMPPVHASTNEPEQQQRIGGPIIPVAQLDSHFAGSNSGSLNQQPQQPALGADLIGPRPMSPVSPNVHPVDRNSSTVSSLTSPNTRQGHTPIPMPPPAGTYPLVPSGLQNQVNTAYQPSPSPLMPAPQQPLPLPPTRSPQNHSRAPSHPPTSVASEPTKVHVKLDPSGKSIQVRRVLPGEVVDEDSTAIIAEGGQILPIGVGAGRPSGEHSRSRSRDPQSAAQSQAPGTAIPSSSGALPHSRVGRSERAQRAAQRERELDRQRGFGGVTSPQRSAVASPQRSGIASPQQRSGLSNPVEMPVPMQVPDREESESPARLAVGSVSGRESVLSAGELTDGAEVREWRKEKRARERSAGRSQGGWSGFE